MRILVVVSFLMLVTAANCQVMNRDSLFAIWNDTTQTSAIRLAAINDICRIIPRDEPEDLLRYAHMQLALAEAKGDTLYQAYALASQGEMLTNMGQYSKAQQCTERSLWLFTALRNLKEQSAQLQNLGNINAKQGNLEQAALNITQSLGAKEILGDKPGIARSLNSLGNINTMQGNYGQALLYLLRGQALCAELKDDECVAPFHNSIGNVYYLQGNYTQALASFMSGLHAYEELKQESMLARTLNNIAGVYLRLGAQQRALEFLERSLDLKAKIGDKSGQASTLANIGIIYYQQGNHVRAIDYLSKGLAISEAVGDKRLTALALSNLGIALDEHGEYASAIEYYMRCLAIYEEIGDQQGLADVMNSLGTSLDKTGMEKAALEYHLKSQFIRENIGDRQGIAESLINIGSLYRESGDIVRARTNFDNALEILKELGDSIGVSTAMSNIAQLKIGQGDYQMALSYADSALRIASHAGSVSDIRDASLTLYEANKLAHKMDVAYQMFKVFSSMTDSMSDAANERAVLKQKLMYDSNLQSVTDSILNAGMANRLKIIGASARELAVSRVYFKNITAGIVASLVIIVAIALFLDGRRRRARHARNSAHLQTQAWRAQVNPHFIHTALQNINAYVRSNERDLASSFLTRFARLMRAVLENARKEEVPLLSDLNVLRDYLELEKARLQDKFTYSIDVDPSIDQDEVHVPPMLLQPFAEEAIWQGFAQGNHIGHITIVVRQVAGSILISIQDDGGVRSGSSNTSSNDIAETHVGTTITRARLELLARQERKPATVRTITLPQGQRVELEIPLLTAA